MSAVIVGLIAGTLPMLGTWIAIRANGRERRKDQKATWDRDDVVAEQAEKAAALLLAAQQESITRTDRVAATVAKTTETTEAKLDVIHILVNSTLTAAKEAELAATQRELTMLMELTNVQTGAGTEPTADRQAAIGALHRRVAELTLAMTDRAKQTRLANIQLATEADRE